MSASVVIPAETVPEVPVMVAEPAARAGGVSLFAFLTGLALALHLAATLATVLGLFAGSLPAYTWVLPAVQAPLLALTGFQLWVVYRLARAAP